jgi:hypothetical protein
VARDPALWEDGAEVAGCRVQEHAIERDPAPGPETCGVSGACPTGGQNQSSLTPGLGTCGCTGACPGSGDVAPQEPASEEEVIESNRGSGTRGSLGAHRVEGWGLGFIV